MASLNRADRKSKSDSPTRGRNSEFDKIRALFRKRELFGQLKGEGDPSFFYLNSCLAMRERSSMN